MLIGDVWISPAMIADVATLTGAHRTTVARWLERRSLPTAVAALLELVYHGRLGRIHDDWCGWSIDRRSGRLVSPDGLEVSTGELRALPYRYAQLAALQRERAAVSAGGGASCELLRLDRLSRTGSPS